MSRSRRNVVRVKIHEKNVTKSKSTMIAITPYISSKINKLTNSSKQYLRVLLYISYEYDLCFLIAAYRKFTRLQHLHQIQNLG